MTKENFYYCKGTDVQDKALQCNCGQEANIASVSNWHDNTGMFYMQCTCGKQFNVRWKKIEKPLSEVQQNLAKLPASCFAVLLTTGELIQIRAGEKGYYRLGQRWPEREASNKGITLDAFADFLNEEDGVTKAQREAMECGSMWGWEVPGANPDLYDKDGIIIKSKLNKL